MDRINPNTPAYFQLQSVEAWLGPRPVFIALSLSLHLQEHTVVLGPNGAGKSALLKLLSRELYPVAKSNSKLRIFGNTTVNLWELRRRIGLVSSDLQARYGGGVPAVDVVLSGFFGSVGIGRSQAATAAQRRCVSELMAELNLAELAARPYSQLSDGQKRRVLLARALIHQPDVLVLDEPTNGLDLRARHQLLSTLRQLAGGGTTLLLVTHQVEAIIPEIQRVVFLKRGQLVGDGTPAQLLSNAPLSSLFDTPLQVVKADGWYQVLPA